MKIAVFGATGDLGRNIVEHAFDFEYRVNALVRNSVRLSEKAAQANIIVGNVLDSQKVAETITGTDAVAVSLGSRSDSPENTVSEGTQHIITAMKDAGVRRLVVVTTLGLGDSKNQVPLVFRMVMKTVMRTRIVDKERQEKFVRESGLDWVIVRPGELTNGPKTGAYTFGTESTIMAKAVSRADVAEFVIKNLTDDQFLYQAVAIS